MLVSTSRRQSTWVIPNASVHLSILCVVHYTALCLLSLPHLWTPHLPGQEYIQRTGHIADMAPITLRGATIDPENAPEGLLPADASATNYILVQPEHALNRQESLQLGALGVQIHRSQDKNHTYLCRYEPEDLAQIERLPFVKHAIIYHPCFVIDGSLKDVDANNPPAYLKIVRPDGEKGRLTCHKRDCPCVILSRSA
jgi:hypothetical protein